MRGISHLREIPPKMANLAFQKKKTAYRFRSEKICRFAKVFPFLSHKTYLMDSGQLIIDNECKAGYGE